MKEYNRTENKNILLQMVPVELLFTYYCHRIKKVCVLSQLIPRIIVILADNKQFPIEKQGCDEQLLSSDISIGMRAL